jgi:type II secretory pathway pseudopilin PulG
VNCPFCAEEINEDAKKCKHCGESLDDDARPPKGGSGKTVLIVALVCVPVCLCVPGILATLLMPALMKAKEKANRTKCANNLRQMGLASIQYSDDKRFFPHVRSLTTLDGAVDSNHSTKKTRTLVYYGYHDNPEGFICPSSFDMFIPSATAFDGRKWFWDGSPNPTDGSLSPIVDGANDPNLEDTSELSYGWSRKGMNSNVRSTTPLLADRAVRDESPNAPTNELMGNHFGGWNVLSADCTVQWLSVDDSPFPGSYLTGTSTQPDAYLDLKPQTDKQALGY